MTSEPDGEDAASVMVIEVVAGVEAAGEVVAPPASFDSTTVGDEGGDGEPANCNPGSVVHTCERRWKGSRVQHIQNRTEVSFKGKDP